MDGPEALPRLNGELTFDAPWQGRVFGLSIALVEEHGLAWDAFRTRLIEAISTHPDRPYYESWTAALESLVIGLGITTDSDIEARVAAGR